MNNKSTRSTQATPTGSGQNTSTKKSLFTPCRRLGLARKSGGVKPLKLIWGNDDSPRYSPNTSTSLDPSKEQASGSHLGLTNVTNIEPNVTNIHVTTPSRQVGLTSCRSLSKRKKSLNVSQGNVKCSNKQLDTHVKNKSEVRFIDDEIGNTTDVSPQKRIFDSPSPANQTANRPTRYSSPIQCVLDISKPSLKRPNESLVGIVNDRKKSSIVGKSSTREPLDSLDTVCPQGPTVCPQGPTVCPQGPTESHSKCLDSDDDLNFEAKLGRSGCEEENNGQLYTQDMLTRTLARIQEKQDKLSALNQTLLEKTRSQEQLRQVTEKWLRGGQSALSHLCDKYQTLGHQLTVAQILEHLQIPPSLLRYSVDDEDFY
uniref:Swi5-dependent recombination DNA repair protein 1 homolog n=1 Tax=Timema douglasi TaxID=61478 RepID=A0A7R8VVM1_TIMDO|nr:unnamed protein product [Timema douglasi]